MSRRNRSVQAFVSVFGAVAVGLWGLVAAPVPAPAQDLFLRGGRLVDPETETVRTVDLLVLDGVIQEATAAPEDFDGETLDVRGRWVLPGLRDFHVHSVVHAAPGGKVVVLGTEGAARRMLYAGVTGFLDLFSDENRILPLRDRQRASRGQVPGADIFAAGPCLTATDGHCTEYPTPTRTIDSPEEARREIADLAKKSPDVVKLVYEHPSPEVADQSWRKPRPTLDRPTLEAAVAAAEERGIPTVIHIRSWPDVEHSVAAGATAVTHLPSVQPIPDALLRRMVETGTVVIPTLAVGDPVLVTERERLDSPLLRAVLSPELIEAYRAVDVEGDERARRMLAGLKYAQEIRAETMKKLADADVPLVAGTDAGNPLTVQGYSLHRELELMVEAGLSPWQALAAATVAAGELVGRSWGLSPGDEGSLVILDASPLEDIRNTRKIHRVIHHGEVVDRETLLAPPAPSQPVAAEE